MAGFVKMKLEGAAEVQRELAKLAKKADLLGEDFADYSAKVVQATVIRNVQPFGAPAKARRSGKRAVNAGLNAAVRPVQRSGKGVITSVSEARAYHNSVRNARGRVRKGARRRNILYPVFMQYLREQEMKVGKAKGSYADSSRKLGNRVVKWVRDWSSGGRVSRSKNLRGVVWSFDSKVKYTNSGHVLGERGIRRVFRKKDGILKRSLEGKLRRMGRM